MPGEAYGKGKAKGRHGARRLVIARGGGRQDRDQTIYPENLQYGLSGIIPPSL